jgi:hypothetical protein
MDFDEVVGEIIEGRRLLLKFRFCVEMGKRVSKTVSNTAQL